MSGIRNNNINQNNKAKETTSESKLKKWFKKLGFAGFLVFLIKGLLWLVVPWAIAMLF